MPCLHKFLPELELDDIDYEPETLIVGTFQPDLPNDGNSAKWFQGRTDDSLFWSVLPQLYGEPSLISGSPEVWKQFCRKHRVAVTDIIRSIEDADTTAREHRKILSGFSEKAIAYHFDDYDFVDIPRLLERTKSIRYVYFVRSITEAFWRNVWNPVMYYCSKHGIRERRLVPPTEEMAYHFNAHNDQHPSEKLTHLEDYLLLMWAKEWHF